MTDSRGALLFLILTLLLVLLFGRFPKILILIVLAISILPVLATVFVPNLQSVRLDFLQRPDSNWVPAIKEKTYGNELCEELLAKSSGFLSNRPVIWKIVVKEASEPQIVHVIGYGHRGQVVSKLSERYSCLFKSYAFSNLASAHNLWLQTWIDIGYIGTLITIFFLYSLACRFSDLFITSHAYAFRSMYSVVVYIILIGSLEATISPDFNLLFILICAISVISIFEIRSHLDDFLK
jgi:O-antigen ligase